MTDEDWEKLMAEIKRNNTVLANRQELREAKIPVKFEDESGYVKLVKHPMKKNHLVWMPF